MFKPGSPKSQSARLRDALWPRIGFRRAWFYRLKRLSRIQVSEHSISLGFATGAFASFTLFMGLHFIIAAGLALALRANLLASAVGTVVGNPLTFPLIWMATYQVGNTILGVSHGQHLADAPFSERMTFSAVASEDLWNSLSSVIMPMLVGGVPLGLVCAAVCYVFVFVSLRKIRQARRREPAISAT